MLSLNVCPVETNQPFYGKYQYSVKFKVPELGVIRGLNYDKIDQIVHDRNKWRADHRKHYGWMNKGEISFETVVKLKAVCKLLAAYRTNIKFVVSYDTGYVYTNDVTLIAAIEQLDFIKGFRVQQSVQVNPPGTISLKNPKWTHRTYFRSKTLSETQKTHLIEYLNSRENVRLSPGLRDWMKSSVWNIWLQGHYFFDHNDDGEILFLNMVIPRITGRTMNIIAK